MTDTKTSDEPNRPLASIADDDMQAVAAADGTDWHVTMAAQREYFGAPRLVEIQSVASVPRVDFAWALQPDRVYRVRAYRVTALVSTGLVLQLNEAGSYTGVWYGAVNSVADTHSTSNALDAAWLSWQNLGAFPGMRIDATIERAASNADPTTCVSRAWGKGAGGLVFASDVSVTRDAVAVASAIRLQTYITPQNISGVFELWESYEPVPFV